MSDDFIGIRQPAFDGLVAGHSRAAAQLDELAQALWAQLNRAGLDTTPATGIRDLASQVRRQADDLGRRQRLAAELQRQQVAPGFCTTAGTQFALPDQLDRVKPQLDGAKAATIAERAAAGDPDALRQFLGYAGESSDPDFAKVFASRLRADGLIDIVGRLGYRTMAPGGDPQPQTGVVRDNRAVLSMLNNVLARVTDPNNHAYLGRGFDTELTKAGRAQHRLPAGQTYNGYWALGQIMRFATTRVPYSGEFAKTVGRDMIDWDHHHPKPTTWPQSLGPSPAPLTDGSAPAGPQPTPTMAADPLLGLMKAAATSRAAAQALLNDNGPPKTLHYLITDRWRQWAKSDHGDALGTLLEKATTGTDPLSKTLAVQLTQVQADNINTYSKATGNRWTITNRTRADALSNLRDSLALILGNHLNDVDQALLDGGHGNRPPFGQELDTDGPRTALFAATDLARILTDLGRDNNAYKSLLWAQTAHMRKELNAAYGAPSQAVVDTVSREAKALGIIVAGHQQALLAEGASQDEITRQDSESSKAMLDFAIGLIPVPGAKQVATASGELTKTAYEAFLKSQYGRFGRLATTAQNSGALDQAFSRTAGENQNMASILQRLTETAAIEHGLDLDRLRSEESTYESTYPSHPRFRFTSGTGMHIKVLPPNTWNRGQWADFESYSRKVGDPEIPDGFNKDAKGNKTPRSASLQKFSEWGAKGYDDGFSDLQGNLGINTHIPGGGPHS